MCTRCSRPSSRRSKTANRDPIRPAGGRCRRSKPPSRGGPNAVPGSLFGGSAQYARTTAVGVDHALSDHRLRHLLRRRLRGELASQPVSDLLEAGHHCAQLLLLQLVGLALRLLVARVDRHRALRRAGRVAARLGPEERPRRPSWSRWSGCSDSSATSSTTGSSPSTSTTCCTPWAPDAWCRSCSPRCRWPSRSSPSWRSATSWTSTAAASRPRDRSTWPSTSASSPT